MTNAIRLAAVTAFAMTFAAGCGGKTACDELADKIADECGVTATGDATGDAEEVECEDGSAEACAAECGLAADCIVFSPPDDLTDQAYLDAAADFADCLAGC